MAKSKKGWSEGKPVQSRERCATPLDEWMEAEGHTNTSLAQVLRINRKRVEWLRNGQQLPTLVWAFRIEQVTSGFVPASSWLATELGQRAWKEETGQ